jgi:FkbM family methyltransferase
MANEAFLAEVRHTNAVFMGRNDWGALLEQISLAIYCSVLRPGDVAVDCGANTGEHTRAMALHVGGNGRVFSFEAVPEMMERAQSHNAAYKNITWVNRALFDIAGQEIEFNYYPNENGLSSIKKREGTSVCVPVNVLTTTLDDEIEDDVALIKLDIEGAEYHALKGANRILRESRPVIIFENGRQASADLFGYSADDFFSLFQSIGYCLYFISGMPFTRELWDEPNHPWQFIAIHPSSPRASRTFAVTYNYACYLRAHYP